MPPKKRPANESSKKATTAKRSKRDSGGEEGAKEAEDGRKSGRQTTLTFVKASTLITTSSSSSTSTSTVVSVSTRYPQRQSAGQPQKAMYVPQPWSARQSTPRGDHNPRECPNFLFYSGVRPSRPMGDMIDRIHKQWKGDYKKLEAHHGYIQWLFPLFEGGGMNYQSSRLTKGEAKLMRESLSLALRIIKSYQLMLDFYGLRLVDKHTGQIKRAKNWKSRYLNMNSHTHNNLRITRILTSLGHLGFGRWKKPLIDFFTDQILEKGHLRSCRVALIKFWTPTLDVTSKDFIKKTGELPEDRTESIYFKHLESGDVPEDESEEDEADYDDDDVSSDSDAEKRKKATKTPISPKANVAKRKGKELAHKDNEDEQESEEQEQETKPRPANKPNFKPKPKTTPN